MPTVEASIEVDAPDHVVFDLAQDYDLRFAWDPFLREMRFENGATRAAVGVKVWVRAKNGIGMTVEYLTVDRPQRVAVRMVSASRLFERFAGTWSFESLAAGRTRVVFRYGFETRFRLVRPLLDATIRAIFARDLRARVLGLKRGAENPALLGRLV